MGSNSASQPEASRQPPPARTRTPPRRRRAASGQPGNGAARARSGGRLRLVGGAPLREALARAMREVVGYAQQMSRQARGRPAFAVHEWRKSMRRARALLRLCRHLLDPSDRDSIAAALRNAQRAASSLRDAEVLLPVIDELAADRQTGAKQRADLLRIKRSLQARRRRGGSPGRAAGTALASHRAPVLAAAARFERVLPPSVGFQDLETGLGMSYRRAVAAYQRTRKDQDDDVAFHDLRKAIKVLHYQTELLSLPGDRRLEKLRKQLSQLAEAQGRVTDLLLLRAGVAAPGARGFKSLQHLLHERIARRRLPAQRAARKLLSRPAGRFAHRVMKSTEKALAGDSAG